MRTKPCPLCRSYEVAAGQIGRANSGIWAAQCVDCGHLGRPAKSFKEAFTNWNNQL